MGKITKKRDQKQSFSLAFDPSSGSIEPTFDNARTGAKIERLQLQLCPVKLRQEGVAVPFVKICLRGQKQRLQLLDRCNVKRLQDGSLRYELPKEFCIQHDESGNWYLELRYRVDKVEPRQGPIPLPANPKVIAVDPGTRTPRSLYTSAGQTVDVGMSQDNDRLDRLRKKIDKLVGQLAKKRKRNRRLAMFRVVPFSPPAFEVKGKERKKLRKLLKKTRRKLSNLVNDLHCRASHFLAAKASVIVMPRMEITGMVSRANFLAPATKRSLPELAACKLCESSAGQVPRYTVRCAPPGQGRDLAADTARGLYLQNLRQVW